MSDQHQANERIEGKLECLERQLKGLELELRQRDRRSHHIQLTTLELDQAIAGLLHEVLCELRQIRRPGTFPATAGLSVHRQGGP